MITPSGITYDKKDIEEHLQVKINGSLLHVANMSVIYGLLPLKGLST